METLWLLSPGHDMELLLNWRIKIQRKKEQILTVTRFLKSRKASQKDIDIWSAAREREEPMKVRARELAISQNWK
jgi:hypothetical protein